MLNCQTYSCLSKILALICINKLTMNSTKSSEALHSDLGWSFKFRVSFRFRGCHSDLRVSFRFKGVIQVYRGHSDLGELFRCAGSVVEVKCLSALGNKTIISEAKLQK